MAKFEEAEVYLLRAVTEMQKQAHPELPIQWSILQFCIEQAQGSRESFALAQCKQQFGGTHSHTLLAINNLVCLLRDQNHIHEAVSVFEGSYSKRKRTQKVCKGLQCRKLLRLGWIWDRLDIILLKFARNSCSTLIPKEAITTFFHSEIMSVYEGK